jgi:hypothetical protein
MIGAHPETIDARKLARRIGRGTYGGRQIDQAAELLEAAESRGQVVFAGYLQERNPAWRSCFVIPAGSEFFYREGGAS